MPVSPTSPIEAVAAGWRLPGIANLHSHAFQRAMAGMAERQTDPNDSFWTWRETMYGMAARFTPELLHAVASQLYVEMLEAGYTSVCEFHYIHHAPDGQPYAPATAMSDALIAAARYTGIRLALLPVLYMSGGFDARPLSARQRRFGHAVDDYLRLLDALRSQQGDMLRVGCALHSLRAVPQGAMGDVLAALPDDARIHIHIAEQVPEVQECIAVRGARPVQWLLDNAAVDARWTLVHATHLDDAEVRVIDHQDVLARGLVLGGGLAIVQRDAHAIAFAQGGAGGLVNGFHRIHRCVPRIVCGRSQAAAAWRCRMKLASELTLRM